MTLTTLQLSNPYGVATYREAGGAYAGQAAPLVLVHGVGMQSASWQPQLDHFGKTRHVIAVDMPGHGGSDCLPDGAALPQFVDWLLAVLDALGLDQVNLAGHSMGALIAGGFAVSHPARLERVALLNGVFCRDTAASAAVKARASQIKQGAFDLETPLNRWFGETPTELDARAKVAAWLSQVRLDGYATAYTAFADGDATYASGFATIACPLLALTGDGDLNSTPQMSKAMAAAAARGRTVVIEGHRHMVNLTAPDAVNAALGEWLEIPVKERDVA